MVFIAALCAALSFGGCADPRAPAGDSSPVTLVKVRDGDSLVVRMNGQPLEVRLHGIDAPERGQPYGDASRKGLVNLVNDKTLLMERRTVDRYDRHVALITVAGSTTSVNQQMLERGHAWHYVRYDQNPAWARSHSAAKSAKKGLWSNPKPIAPWEWRQR
ncbi:MAG: thermonuclease family protein [Gammaproteobacteria bacterium]